MTTEKEQSNRWRGVSFQNSRLLSFELIYMYQLISSTKRKKEKMERRRKEIDMFGLPSRTEPESYRMSQEAGDRYLSEQFHSRIISSLLFDPTFKWACFEWMHSSSHYQMPFFLGFSFCSTKKQQYQPRNCSAMISRITATPDKLSLHPVRFKIESCSQTFPGTQYWMWFTDKQAHLLLWIIMCNKQTLLFSSIV